MLFLKPLKLHAIASETIQQEFQVSVPLERELSFALDVFGLSVSPQCRDLVLVQKSSRVFPPFFPPKMHTLLPRTEENPDHVKEN